MHDAEDRSEMANDGSDDGGLALLEESEECLVNSVRQYPLRAFLTEDLRTMSWPAYLMDASSQSIPHFIDHHQLLLLFAWLAHNGSSRRYRPCKTTIYLSK